MRSPARFCEIPYCISIFPSYLELLSTLYWGGIFAYFRLYCLDFKFRAIVMEMKA